MNATFDEILRDFFDLENISFRDYLKSFFKSQPPRFYGLLKVHKDDIPVRLVFLMHGSAYHKVAVQVLQWL